MRNLKRALSLTLASVMLLGMMVVGTSAASYPDVTEEHNVEAIEVLQAVGVMSGSDSGNFNPDSQVSRIEMAVVMSNLLNLKVDYFENQCRFTDVPAWAGKYVAACEASGIVSGIGNNQFGTGNVTATQAALMMLKALGYFQYASDFAGGWEQETAKLAANLSLFKGLDSVYNTTELTRNQVAQLALNVLKTPVVVPEDNTLTVSGQGSGVDFTINGGRVTYKVTASQDTYARAISAVEGSDQTTVNGIAGFVIELGEKLYDGKLQLRENGRDGAVYDEFGRPSRRWQYDGVVFGTYPKTEELRQEYTQKVTGKMLYDLLGSDIIDGIKRVSTAYPWGLSVTVDGETDYSVLSPTGAYFSEISMTRSNTDAVGDTGNGVLTQVYVDSLHRQVNIAIINTYLAQAQQDYNTKDDDVDLKVWSISEKNHLGAYVKSEKDDNDPTVIVNLEEKMTAQGDKVEITDIKKDDLVLVTVANGEIQSVKKPEIVSETTLNSFKKGSWVKNDDAQYDYADTAYYDDEVLDEYSQTNMKDVTYNVILDPYGYMIGIELNEAANQYVFLTGLDLGGSNLSVKNATANVIFLDGTMKTVTVNVEKSEYAKKVAGQNFTITGRGEDLNSIDDYVPTFANSNRSMSQINTWCTYTVDGDGVYTLKQVGSLSTARSSTTPGGAIKDAKKVAQSAVNVDALNARPSSDTNSDSEVVINNKNTFLMGSNHADVNDVQYYGHTPGVGDNVVGDFQYVYGNNDTVYINASLKGVTTKSDGYKYIVNKVDSVVTGISNVDLNVGDLTDDANLDTPTAIPTNEIYTLYNDKGYAIAVVVLNATDNGTSSRYVYITDSVSQEDYTGNSEWKWYREAIMDGEKVLLTEIDDGWDYLSNDNMETGKWYSVTFNKDGHVNGVKKETGSDRFVNFDYAPFDQNDNGSFADSPDRYPDKFVTTVAQVNLATEGKGDFNKTHDSVLLYADFRCGDVISPTNTHTNSQIGVTVDHNPHTPVQAFDPAHPERNGVEAPAWIEVKGDTVFTTRDNNLSAGFRINDNTKIVLITSKSHNGGLFDQVIDGYKGAEGLNQALDDLDAETVDNKTQFDGVLTAIFDRGVATVLILNDESGNGRNKTPENDGSMRVVFDFKDGATSKGTLTKNIKVDTTFMPSTLLTEKGLSGYKVSDNSSIKVTYERRGTITIDIPVEAVVEETMVVEVNWKNGPTDNKMVYELKVPAGKTMSFVPGTTKDKDNVVIAPPAGTVLGSKTSETIFVTTDSLIKVEFPVKTAKTIKVVEMVEGVPTEVEKTLAEDTTYGSLITGSTSANEWFKVTVPGVSGAPATTKYVAGNSSDAIDAGATLNPIDKYVKVKIAIANATISATAAVSVDGATDLGTVTVALKDAASMDKADSNANAFLKVGETYKVTLSIPTAGASGADVDGSGSLAVTIAADNGLTTGVTTQEIYANGVTIPQNTTKDVEFTVGGTVTGVNTLTVSLVDKAAP